MRARGDDRPARRAVGAILDKTATREDRRLYARALLDLKVKEGAATTRTTSRRRAAAT
jgi:hypothetical protein